MVEKTYVIGIAAIIISVLALAAGLGEPVAGGTTIEEVNVTQQLIFTAIESGGGQAIGATYTNITLDTTVVEDEYYSHTPGSHEITILADGWFYVSYWITTEETAGSTRTSSLSRLVEDTGSGFTLIPGTTAEMYNRLTTTSGTNAAVSLWHYFTNGTVIALQASVDDGGGTLNVMADSTGISILSLRGTITYPPMDGTGGWTNTSTDTNTSLNVNIQGNWSIYNSTDDEVVRHYWDEDNDEYVIWIL